ncbi:MAG: 5'-methylthioadenosine/adenosylhomocysteine nucleosidase [Clostridia bacterium]|nr:5'-methylthioadenosine/adenosylhomocysteine nucleosidase [Clostridia bacterium]
MKYKKIGIICAMEIEAAEIRSALSDLQEKTVGGILFHSGKMGEREVVIAVCGIGKVFAAMCAQTMILAFAPDAIYNSGVAGSLTEKLSILDVAVSEKLVQHDMDTTPLGDPPGLISGINRVFFPGSDDLTAAVAKEGAALGLRVLPGTIASGDQFISKAEQKKRIKETFDPIACEMEGAAIAQVAFVNKIPFCAIRAISDAYDGKNEMDYARFAPAAAHNSAKLLISLLKGELL